MASKGEASSSSDPKGAKKDFSTAILERKKAPNRLIVDEAINDDNSVVSMNPETMEKLQLFRGDTILLKADIERERRRSENPEAMEEDEADEVAEIKPAHFEESMKYARRSVSDADIRKYQAFAQTLQQSRGFGSEFRFSERSETGAGAAGSDPFASAAAGADDDDLYN
ncbi:hypothetical protein COCNU_10G007770 [Cocos nucifera]|uniref:Uncharacterized protein n=1 Tax=Cocos nucifera TaxID=13894 RepID=A0A8K0N8F9_COCNU|nr:hypothetical protein COCNU_10G007770 [Cocos nucifera]